MQHKCKNMQANKNNAIIIRGVHFCQIHSS